jgi:glycosyltransferase involved in cell wall biosynthesis
VLEAMACGTPVVAGPGGSVPEVGGDAVLWADPEEPDALAAAMESALGDEQLRATMRDRGLARASAFTWERTGARIADVLAELGAEGRR